MGLFVRRLASGLKSNKLSFEEICIFTGQYITPSTCWECFLEVTSLVGYLIALAGETIILVFNGCSNAKCRGKEICPLRYVSILLGWRGNHPIFLHAISGGGMYCIVIALAFAILHYWLIQDESFDVVNSSCFPQWFPWVSLDCVNASKKKGETHGPKWATTTTNTYRWDIRQSVLHGTSWSPSICYAPIYHWSRRNRKLHGLLRSRCGACWL